MENLNIIKDFITIGVTAAFSLGGTLAVTKYLLNKHEKKIEQLEESQKQFVEKAAHDADMRMIHDRITKKDDELKKSIEGLEKEVSAIAREISRIVGFIEGREKT